MVFFSFGFIHCCTQHRRRGSVEIELILIMNNPSPTIVTSQSVMIVETEMEPMISTNETNVSKHLHEVRAWQRYPPIEANDKRRG